MHKKFYLICCVCFCCLLNLNATSSHDAGDLRVKGLVGSVSSLLLEPNNETMPFQMDSSSIVPTVPIGLRIGSWSLLTNIANPVMTVYANSMTSSDETTTIPFVLSIHCPTSSSTYENVEVESYAPGVVPSTQTTLPLASVSGNTAYYSVNQEGIYLKLKNTFPSSSPSGLYTGSVTFTLATT